MDSCQLIEKAMNNLKIFQYVEDKIDLACKLILKCVWYPIFMFIILTTCFLSRILISNNDWLMLIYLIELISVLYILITDRCNYDKNKTDLLRECNHKYTFLVNNITLILYTCLKRDELNDYGKETICKIITHEMTHVRLSFISNIRYIEIWIGTMSDKGHLLLYFEYPSIFTFIASILEHFIHLMYDILYLR